MSELPKGWSETVLDEVCMIKYGKDHKKLNDGDVPCYGSGGLMRNVDSFLYSKPSVLIPRKGTLSNLFYIDKPFWTVDTLFYTIINEKKILPKYLFFKLKTMNLASMNVGSAVPSLTTSRLNQIKIKIPNIKEQKAIANILSSFDNKIELLKEQNKTLETMAQTIFKEWFVNNKSNSWDEKPLTEIASFLNGLACQKFPPANDKDKLPVLKIKELKEGINNNSDWATTNVKNEYIINSGDVIFAWSASLLVKIWDGQKSILNQHLFKVTSKEFPKWFYFQWCKYHLYKFISIAKSKATTMGHIKRTDLDNAMCFIPNKNIIQNFDKLMNGIMKKIKNNSSQIQTLQKTRDTLLPKLMSGKIRVKYDKIIQKG